MARARQTCPKAAERPGRSGANRGVYKHELANGEGSGVGSCSVHTADDLAARNEWREPGERALARECEGDVESAVYGEDTDD